MLSFMIPSEEKGFNLNSVQQQQQQQQVPTAAPENGVYQVTNGHVDVKTELSASGVLSTSEVAHHGSPNNNSHPTTPLLATVTSALDNMTSAAPMSRDLPLMPAALTSHDLPLSRDLPLTAPPLGCYSGSSSLLEDSYSDDAVNESTLLIRAEDRSDEMVTPSTEHVTEVMTPSTENTRSSPCGEEKPLLPQATIVSGKTGKLKRVSFGSSKGSMVETVVYDYEPVQPLREEGGESPDPRSLCRHNFVTSTPLSAPARPEQTAAERAASRVRVTYFESKKPLVVPAPDPSEVGEEEESEVTAPPPAHTQVTTEVGEMPTTYIVQTMDAGWENPFRPGGELSKEADQIVRAIQSGRPLDFSLDEADAAAAAAGTLQINGDARADAAQNGAVLEPVLQPVTQTMVAATAPSQTQPPASAAAERHRNGGGAAAAAGGGDAAVPQTALAAQQPGTVEVQHSLVKPEDASQVEQVTLKKKPRGKCCVLQ